MRLAACGVAAMQNTPSSIAGRITQDNPYWSASYHDVCAAVNREILLAERIGRAFRSARELMEPDAYEMFKQEVGD